MAANPRCQAMVHTVGMSFSRGHQCQRNAKVERKGEWFCSQHDPEKIKAKRVKEANAFTARINEAEAITDEATSLAKQLGVEGNAYYYAGNSYDSSGYRRSLVISFEDVKKLIERSKK